MKIKFKKHNTTENLELKKEVYLDKATNLLRFAIAILVFDMLTYFIAALFELYDFGFYFEFTSLITTILTLKSIKKQNITKAKKYLIISMFAIAWLLLYDLILLFPRILDVLITFLRHYYIPISDLLILTLIAILVFLYKGFKALRKAENNPIDKENETYADRFYDEM